MKRAILAGQRRSGEKMAREGSDPLLWELGQLREIVQRSVAYAESTGDFTATASLVRAGNGLLVRLDLKQGQVRSSDHRLTLRPASSDRVDHVRFDAIHHVCGKPL
jgi:hypothetical protein